MNLCLYPRQCPGKLREKHSSEYGRKLQLHLPSLLRDATLVKVEKVCSKIGIKFNQVSRFYWRKWRKLRSWSLRKFVMFRSFPTRRVKFNINQEYIIPFIKAVSAINKEERKAGNKFWRVNLYDWTTIQTQSSVVCMWIGNN